MLIDQENNIEHYPIAFNIFSFFQFQKKYFAYFTKQVHALHQNGTLNALNVLKLNLKDNYLAKHYITHDVLWRAKKHFSLYWTLNVQP